MASFYKSLEDLIKDDFLGRYTFINKLGSGGMGTVYLADDKALQRKVVLKFLKPIFLQTIAVQRFFREARMLGSLNHPNIVTIHDFGTFNKFHYLVMEYLHGKTLRQIIRKESPLSAERIKYILTQILDALEVAHSSNIIHRDLKPSNIFSVAIPNNDEFIKIIDFGLAKPLFETEDTSITKTGEIIGTPKYMSPEQIMGKKELSAQCDLYSLGVILYEMLSGNLPFDSKSPAEVCMGHVRMPPPQIVSDAGNHNPLREQLIKVTFNCLQKKPKDRFSSIQDMRNALNY